MPNIETEQLKAIAMKDNNNLNPSSDENLTKAERNFFDEVEQTLTKRQVEVLKNICKLERLPKSKNQFLKKINVAKSSWHSWKQNRTFISALTQLGTIRHADDLLYADESIAQKAREGDVQAGRYLREILGINSKTPIEHNVRVELKPILPD
jgi:DNA replication initiation complex subunit (GINS family)